MDIKTKYLGLTLNSPLVGAASPLSADLAAIRQMEDAGAGAVVLHSLFEEQLILERRSLEKDMEEIGESFPEALKYFPEVPEFRLGPEAYLEHIRKAKAAVDIPVIASLNGSSVGGWTGYARRMEEAGADAIEVNIYSIPSNSGVQAADIERQTIEIAKLVKAAVSVPVAVKLSPYFSNLSNVARRLDEAGARGLVLFNRFYQPDIDIETREVKTNVLLSSTAEMRLPLRWIAMLYGHVKADLAATTGIHDAKDVIKMLMAGASVTMLCSVLLKKGVSHLGTIKQELGE